MRTLVGFELKKICKRRSTWVAFFILLAIQILLAISANLGTTQSKDGQVIETHMQRNRIDRKNGVALSGRLIDDVLLSEVQEAYAKLDGMDSDEYLVSELTLQEVRKYYELHYKLNVWCRAGSPETVTAGDLYAMRRAQIERQWEDYKLSDAEKSYWQKKEETLPEIFTYQYAEGYTYLISDLYFTGLLLTFFVVICMVTVFMEEHSLKTDQLILCTRLGRGRLYAAKIIAGSLVSLAAAVIFTIVIYLGDMWCLGTEGFHAAIQVASAFFSSYNMSAGQVAWILIGLLILVVLLTAVAAMLLSEIMKNSVGAMAVLIGLAFATRLVEVPAAWRTLSRLWNLMPLNQLHYMESFVDPRLISVFGLWLTSWQAAFILYPAAGILIVLAGKQIYCRSEVKSR